VTKTLHLKFTMHASTNIETKSKVTLTG